MCRSYLLCVPIFQDGNNGHFPSYFNVEGVYIKIWHFACLKLKSNCIDFEKERIYHKKTVRYRIRILLRSTFFILSTYG